MVDGVLIQCVSFVCRSHSAFLLSVCMSVSPMASICMSESSMASICMSLVVCWLFLKWYVDSCEVLCFTSAFHLVVCVDCLVCGRDTVCGIF